MQLAKTSQDGALGWALEAFGRFRSARSERAAARQMRVIETLTIGPKKQLLLVSCGGMQFLVGTGAESVQTIVRVGPDVHHGVDGQREWL